MTYKHSLFITPQSMKLLGSEQLEEERSREEVAETEYRSEEKPPSTKYNKVCKTMTWN